MNINSKRARHRNIILVIIALGNLALACNFGLAAERVLVLDSSKASDSEGSYAKMYRYTPFSLQNVPNGNNAARRRVQEENNKLLNKNTFVVYTIDETYTRSEIDGKINAERAAAANQLKETAVAAKAELLSTKSDMLKAISQSVGRQLSAEELNKIKAALLPEIREQLRAELSQELKAELKAELLRELSRSGADNR